LETEELGTDTEVSVASEGGKMEQKAAKSNLKF
jgi:hypothetical protein